jgi:hypothetical protein
MRVRLRILNWEKFNEKRKDVKEPGWLRLEKKFPMSKSLWGIGAADRYVFVTLMCLACDEQSATLDFDSGWFAQLYGGGAFSEDVFLSALNVLNGKVIEVEESTAPPRIAPVTSTVREGHEHGPLRTDGRDETQRNETDEEDDRPRLDELGLDGIALGNFLDDNPALSKDRVTHTLLVALVQGYPLSLVRDVLPRARAAWELESTRRSDYVIETKGGRLSYLRHWLENEKLKQEKANSRAGPKSEVSIGELLRRRKSGEIA